MCAHAGRVEQQELCLRTAESSAAAGSSSSSRNAPSMRSIWPARQAAVPCQTSMTAGTAGGTAAAAAHPAPSSSSSAAPPPGPCSAEKQANTVLGSNTPAAQPASTNSLFCRRAQTWGGAFTGCQPRAQLLCSFRCHSARCIGLARAHLCGVDEGDEAAALLEQPNLAGHACRVQRK